MKPSITLRSLAAAAALAATQFPHAFAAEGDMESDYLPNSTLFFEELLPSHEAVDEAELLADLGRMFDHPLLSGQFKESDLDKIFEMAEKHPDVEAVFSPLVQAAGQRELHDKIIPRLLELADRHPTSRELNLTAAELLVQEKRIDDAIPYFERAFEVVREDPEPPSERRREYNANIASKLILVYSDKALDKARRADPALADEVAEYLEKLHALRAEVQGMKAFDSAPQVRSALIISCAGEMDVTGAKSPLATSVLIPFDEDAWRLRDEMETIVETTLQNLLNRKKELENPELPAPFRTLLGFGYGSRIMAAALSRLAEAPDDTEALFCVAILADELGEPLLGARAWDRIFAVVKSPDPGMFAVCVSLQMSAGLYDEAERTYRILGSLIDDQNLLNGSLGQLEFDRGNYKKALEYLKRAPLDAQRMLLESECYRYLGDWSRALERLRNAMRTAPELARRRGVRLMAANLADKANDMQCVEEMLAPMLRQSGFDDGGISDAEVYNSLGYIFADHGHKLTDALGYIQKAVELEPENGAIADSLAWVFYRLGRFQEAQREIVRAIGLMGDKIDATILDHAGDIYAALGDMTNARDYWRRALSLNGDVDYDAIERKIAGSGAR